MTTYQMVKCWCCGRDSEGVPLDVVVPVALKVAVQEWATTKGETETAVVQRALAMWFHLQEGEEHP